MSTADHATCEKCKEGYDVRRGCKTCNPDSPPPEPPTFADAKLWEKVWSLEFGWGEIEKIRSCLVVVQFENCRDNYYFNGSRFNWNDTPTLFWDEVKIVPPERPGEPCGCEKVCIRYIVKDSMPRATFVCVECGLEKGEVHAVFDDPNSILNKCEQPCEACDHLEGIKPPIVGFYTPNLSPEQLAIKWLADKHHTCGKETV